MPSLKLRNSTYAFAVETAEGVDQNPTIAANLISRATGLTIAGGSRAIDDNEQRGGLGAGEPIVVDAPMTATLTVNMAASGVVGTAPEVGDMLECCGMSETISTVLPAAGTVTATGGTTTSLTFDRSVANGTQFSAVNGSYIGHPILLTTNPATPTISHITDYTVAGTIVTIKIAHTMAVALSATTTFTKPGNVDYTPHSGAIPTGTLHVYRDASTTTSGVKWALLGNRGNMEITSTAAEKWTQQFSLQGTFGSKTDSTLATTPGGGSGSIVVWSNSSFTLDRVRIGLRAFSIGLGTTGVNPPNPNAINGFDPYELTGRTVQGAADPLLTLVATRDLWTKMRNQTFSVFHAMLGPATGGTAGTRIAVTLRDGKFREVAEQDDQGLIRDNTRFQAVGVNSEFHLNYS